MAYEKQTWANGDTITAPKLNKIEGGVKGNYVVEILKSDVLSIATIIPREE